MRFFVIGCEASSLNKAIEDVKYSFSHFMETSMKSLFKILLFTTTTALTFNMTQAFATETSKAPVVNHKNQDAYALGTSFGRYLKEQEKLGINLDKKELMQGLEDVFSNTNKLTTEEMEKTLTLFQEKVKTAIGAKMEKDFEKNVSKGGEYSEKFSKETGVKKTQSGLLYKIEKAGNGKAPKDTDTVVVHYIGSLIDGTEFDNSIKRGEPLSIPLNNLIVGWKEGLQKIGKGGKIKLVIPQQLAYGKNPISTIPAGSTLVFDVELLDIKPASETEVDPSEGTKQ